MANGRATFTSVTAVEKIVPERKLDLQLSFWTLKLANENVSATFTQCWSQALHIIWVKGKKESVHWTSLGELHIQRSSLFCRLFGQDGLCASCEKRIRAFEMTMRVRDKVYHLECFKCAACQKHFCVGDRYLLINSDIVCEQDIFEWTKLNGNLV